MTMKEQIQIVEDNLNEYGQCNITLEEYNYIKDELYSSGCLAGMDLGRAEAVEEYKLKLLNAKTDKVKSIHEAKIWVEFKRQAIEIAEQLKEQK